MLTRESLNQISRPRRGPAKLFAEWGDIMSDKTENAPDSSPQQKETFGSYIQIVGPVFYNKKFSDKTKLLYGLLAAMTQAPRYYAFAKNSTLMRFLNCSERTLQTCLNQLKDAGELTIENGDGGRTLRKIRLTRLQPVYPAENCGVYPAENCGGNKNNRKRKGKGAEAPVATQEDIIQWFNCWVAKMELSQEDSIALCTDLRALVENREAIGKPFVTINGPIRMAGRLKNLTADSSHPVALMRYLLSRTIVNNWADIFPLEERDAEDFNRYLATEYGIAGTAATPEYF